MIAQCKSQSRNNHKIRFYVMDRMGFEPTTFAGIILTQCECVIQTKLDDRSKFDPFYDSFVSLE